MLHGLCFGEEAGAQNLVFFPTLTCGVFVFSAVSAPSPPPPPACPQILTHTYLPHTYITQSHTAAFAHTSNHSLTHSLTHTHHSHYTYITHPKYTHHTAPQLHTPHTHHSLHSTPLHSTPLTYHSHAHIPDTITRTHITHITLPVAFAWQVRRLVLCERSDGVAGASRWLLHAAPLGALQGVGCTPWRPLLSAALPVAFAWQVRHCAALGALQAVGCIRPGVPWCRLQAVGWRGRCGTWCSASGRMYALAGLRRSADAQQMAEEQGVLGQLRLDILDAQEKLKGFLAQKKEEQAQEELREEQAQQILSQMDAIGLSPEALLELHQKRQKDGKKPIPEDQVSEPPGLSKKQRIEKPEKSD